MRDRLRAPLFLVRVFDSEELHMLSRSHRHGCSRCRLGCHLAAGLAALLIEGLAQGLEALGAGLASRLARGPSPCGKQVASGRLRAKYKFPLVKTFASPHTPHTLFAHTISVSDELSRSSSTPLGRPLSTDVSDETSESVASCEASVASCEASVASCEASDVDPYPDPEVPVPTRSPSDEPEMVTEDWKEA